MSDKNSKLYEEFMEKLWIINEKGDPREAFKELLFQLKSKNAMGIQNTISNLTSSYREYVDYTTAHIHKDPKFRKKGDELLNLYRYLVDRVYNQSFKLPISARDEYLYGIKREDTDV